MLGDGEAVVDLVDEEGSLRFSGEGVGEGRGVDVVDELFLELRRKVAVSVGGGDIFEENANEDRFNFPPKLGAERPAEVSISSSSSLKYLEFRCSRILS